MPFDHVNIEIVYLLCVVIYMVNFAVATLDLIFVHVLHDNSYDVIKCLVRERCWIKSLGMQDIEDAALKNIPHERNRFFTCIIYIQTP